jgi:hypothetical protein
MIGIFDDTRLQQKCRRGERVPMQEMVCKDNATYVQQKLCTRLGVPVNCGHHTLIYEQTARVRDEGEIVGV